MRTRDPRGPTQAPTGSTPSAWETTAIFERKPGSRATPDDLDELVGDLGHLEGEQLLDQLGALAGDDDARALALGGDVGDDGLDPRMPWS